MIGRIVFDVRTVVMRMAVVSMMMASGSSIGFLDRLDVRH